MSKFWWAWLAGLLALAIVGCERTLEQQKLQAELEEAEVRPSRSLEYELPFGAVNIKDRGNGWLTFQWEGREFLYQLQGSHGGHAAMTELAERPKPLAEVMP